MTTDYLKKLALLLGLIIIFCYASFAKADTPNASEPHYTFVLVHGATGGGWDWKEVDQLLTAKGHTVYRPTLTGLGEKYHLLSPEIDLTTHINDVVNMIIFEALDNIVLVGHSYGGMVITGVMDKIPERIHHVTFLDAKVPEDGMSMSEGKPLPESFEVIDGIIHFPWVDKTQAFPRDVVQSLKTFTEPVSYKNPKAKLLNVSYVAFVPKKVTLAERATDPSWARAEKRNWTIRTFAGNHVIYRAKPVLFTEMLASTVDDRNQN